MYGGPCMFGQSDAGRGGEPAATTRVPRSCSEGQIRVPVPGVADQPKENPARGGS